MIGLYSSPPGNQLKPTFMRRLLAAMLIVAVLGACGMKGELYLPEGESNAPPLKDQGIDPVLDPSEPWDADDLDDPIDGPADDEGAEEAETGTTPDDTPDPESP